MLERRSPREDFIGHLVRTAPLHAGQIGAQLIEELTRIPADTEPASEFRYRNPAVEPGTLSIAVSQSGEFPVNLLEKNRRMLKEIRARSDRILAGAHAPK